MDADIIQSKPSGTYMNDSLFVQLGFYTGTSTAFQRLIGYGVAETQMARYLGTFVSPVTVTGTYPFVTPNTTIELDAGQLISVNSVTLIERVSDMVDRYISGTALILDPRNGYIRVNISPLDNSTCAGCPGTVGSSGIYKALISYTAGYQTGQMVNDPSFIAALGMAADIVISQLSDVGLGSEYEGGALRTLQIGRLIKSWDTKHFVNSPFGESARAKTITTLVTHLQIKRVGHLGR